MNEKDIIFVLNHINKIILNTILKRDNNSIFDLKIEAINKKHFIKKFEKYMSDLLDNYKDINEVHMHLVYVFIEFYQIKEINYKTYNSNGFEMDMIDIFLQNDKVIELNIPTNYIDSEIRGLLENFKEKIEYDEIKRYLSDKIDENVFDLYDQDKIDNLIILNSDMTSGAELFNEVPTKQKSLYCFSKNLKVSNNKDTLVMISDDFLNNNKELVDEYSYKDGKLKITYKNGKIFETTNLDLLKSLKETLEETQNKLIDIKTKKLYKQK